MTKPTTARSRTITWKDPVAAAEQRFDLSGLDHLNAIREGRVAPPPMAVLMGLDLVEAGEAGPSSPSRPRSSTTTRSASSTAASPRR